MGIYPEFSYKEVRGRPGAESQLHARTETPGFARTVVYVALMVIEDRTNCFCCSCDGSSDPHCRNHGWLANRPCEVHDMPGQVHHPDDEGQPEGAFTPYVPESVQKYNARREGATRDA